MKLLVTGSNGFVAGSIIAQCPSHWEVHGVSRTGEIDGINGIVHHQLDMLDKEKLSELLGGVRPDAVIHTAAIANIDFCEQNKYIAEQINTGVTAHLSNLCKSIDAKLVFCSTDTVFDGNKGNYIETDIPHAVNFYAETKIKSENAVLSDSAKNVVARLSLVIGLPVMGKGNSFLSDIIEKFTRAEPVRFPANEIRTPIDVITLGSALAELAGNMFGGVIHLGGNTSINRFEMAKQITEALGFSKELVVSINSNTLPGRAPRPNNASLNNSKARQLLATPMCSLSEGLSLTMNFKPAQQPHE